MLLRFILIGLQPFMFYNMIRDLIKLGLGLEETQH